MCLKIPFIMNNTENAKKLNKNSIDMTKGPLVKNMLTFAIPIALTVFLQLLYNSADLAVVGKFAVDPEISLAAIGTTTPVTVLLVNLFMGLSLGSNVIVAQHIGAKNSESISDAVHTSIIVSVILGIFCGALGLFISEQILILMNCEGQLLTLSSQYLKIIFIGMPFNMIYNFGACILRANGDTKRPFIILVFSGLLNVILNLILVIFFNLDVLGVAIATISSQFVSSIAVIILLITNKDDTHISFKKLKIHKEQLKKILAVGLPSGVQAASFSIPNIIAKSYLLELGNAMSSATTIQWNVGGYIMGITSAFNQTTVAFVAQNYGAKKYDYIKTIVKTALKLSLAITAAVCFLLSIFSNQILSLFTDSSEILKYANMGFLLCVAFYLFWAVSEVSLGATRGMGDKLVPTIIHFTVNCMLRVLYFIFIFPLNKSYIFVTLIFPLSWTLSGILQFIWYKIFYRKVLKRAKENLG